MFLVLFSTVNTCLINWLNGFLDLDYALWISCFSLLGSVLGMICTDWAVRITGKASIMVWILVAVFVISTISTPVFGGLSVADDKEHGVNIFAFIPLCKSP